MSRARSSVPRCASIALTALSLASGAAGAEAQLASRGDSSFHAAIAAHDTLRAGAEDETPSPVQPLPRHPDRPFFGVWAAASRHAPFKTRLGTRYHDLYLAGLRTGWTVARGNDVSLDYVVNAVPMAIMAGNPEYQLEESPPCRYGEVCALTGTITLRPSYHSVYGFGLAPLGVQLRLFTRSPVRLVLHVNGGALWFARPVPDPKATRFNFTAEGGGAVEWRFTRHDAISVGYEFHHTSNAATGDVNPGLNSAMLTIGITRWRD